MTELHTVACERARVWAALQPDGGLSSFELRLLEAHLDRCPDCAGFAASVAETTTQLRDAALVELPYPVKLPRRRRAAARLAPLRVLAPVAAAAAVVAVSFSLGASHVGNHASSQGRLLLVVTTPSDERSALRELRSARREQLVSENSIRVDDFRPGTHS